MYYPSGKNKGADQLRGYSEADLCLCFAYAKKNGFLTTRLIWFSYIIIGIIIIFFIIHVLEKFYGERYNFAYFNITIIAIFLIYGKYVVTLLLFALLVSTNCWFSAILCIKPELFRLVGPCVYRNVKKWNTVTFMLHCYAPSFY